MRIKSISLTTLFAAGATAVAIVAAPAAMAAPAGPANPAPAPATCGAVTPGSSCITPGNAEINDSPLGGVDYDPYGGFGLALGGYGGGYGGGFHGGGGGHGR